MTLQLHQVSTGRVFVHGFYRPIAVLDVAAELATTRTDTPRPAVSLTISGDGAYRDPITLDLDEAVLLAEAVNRAVLAFSTVEHAAVEVAA